MNAALGLHGYTLILDPGNAKTIIATKGLSSVPLVSAAAETRTLGAPTRSGDEITLFMRTDGGDITVTVTGGFNETGDTTFVFSDTGQFATFTAIDYGGTKYWRLVSHYGLGNASPTEAGILDGMLATAAELNTVHLTTLTGTAGTGFSTGTGTIYKTSTMKVGDIFKTSIMVDITGLGSSTTDLDIIGTGVGPAHIGVLNAAQCGTTILCILMTCMELPITGVTDIDLYSGTTATGAFDIPVTDLVETALITSGAVWTVNRQMAAGVVPASTEYLYLANGAAGVVGTYTGGKFLIEIYGY